MRQSLFVNYAPITGLGQKIIATPATPKPADDWLPSNTPGVTIRTGKDGRMQTNGDALMVDKDAAPKVEPKREPPYLPPDFGGFEYHGADGRVTRLATPVAEPADPITAEDCRAAYLAVPAGDDRKDLAVLQRFVPSAKVFGDLTSALQVPAHRRAEFIAAMKALHTA